MSKNHSGGYSPLLLKYLRKYQEDPTSTVFAPLAESYRKAGLIDEAIQICKEGLAYHPRFASGKVALARCYFDQEKFGLVKKLLSDIVIDYPENLVAKKLYAESAFHEGNYPEAKTAFQQLLHLDPENQEALGFLKQTDAALKKGGNIQPPPPPKNPSRAPLQAPPIPKKSEIPRSFATHTMVDILIEQNLREKAKETLQQILVFNPNDALAKNKLLQLESSIEKPDSSDKIAKLQDLLQRFQKIRTGITDV